MLEVERPNRAGWRSSKDEAAFPPGVEAVCTEALKSAGIGTSRALRSALRSKSVKAAEKSFSALSLQAPTHLASSLIVVVDRSPIIFRDYFPDMVNNPAMALLLKARER
jgi:hypothetical protein